MTQKKILFALYGLIAILAITSCNNQFSGYEKTDTGIYYKIFSANDTLKAKVGDVLTIGMSYKAGDSLLFSSYIDGRPFQMVLQEPQYQGDVFECMGMLSLGDSAEFVIKADSFFYVTARAPALPPFVDSTDYMTFNMKLNKVQTQEEVRQEREAELAVMKDKEPELIEEYVKANNVTVTPDEQGLYYIETQRGTGAKVKEGMMVIINYTLKFTSGETLFSSLDRGQTIDFEYGTQFDTEGFRNGIGKMRKGGKATFIVPSSLGYGAQGAGQQIAPYTPLVYEIDVVDVRDKAEFEKEKAAKEEAKNAELAKAEQEAISKYLSDNAITVSPTESGLYYIETEAGDGEVPISGDKVKVHYTLTNLNNDTIDSSVTRNQPLDFTIDQPGIVEGWHEAIKLMRVGGKAIWLIPSKLAYGPQGRQPMIPPFTPLVFEVEFVEIVK